MKKITTKIVSIVMLLLVMISLSAPVFADSTTAGNGADSGGTANNSSGSATFTIKNPLNNVTSIGSLVETFVEIISYIAILFAVVMFIYTGFQYVVSSASGNATKISELHSRLLWIAVGVAVIIGAKITVQLIINTLSATGTISPGVIQNANNAIPK